MPRILRVRQAGTGSGGIGNPKAVPGVMTKAQSMSKNDPRWLRTIAAVRQKAANQIRRTTIGSRGRL
jgi:hypothetical protein